MSVDGGELIYINQCPHVNTSFSSPTKPAQGSLWLPDPQVVVLPSPCRAIFQLLGGQYWCQEAVVAVSLLFFYQRKAAPLWVWLGKWEQL